MVTPQATITERTLSIEDVLCSKTTMRILKALKRYGRLNTSEIARKVNSSFTLAASRLRMLENQDVLTHADFGVRSHIYRFNNSPRAIALIELLEAWEQGEALPLLQLRTEACAGRRCSMA
jgi:ribosomal protein S25